MIHICQLLCPSRHCIIAMPFDPVEQTLPDIIIEMGEQLKKLGVQKHCGICGSAKLDFESRPTRFKTIGEALPAIRQNEIACIQSRALLDAMGATFDVQQRAKNN